MVIVTDEQAQTHNSLSFFVSLSVKVSVSHHKVGSRLKVMQGLELPSFAALQALKSLPPLLRFRNTLTLPPPLESPTIPQNR